MIRKGVKRCTAFIDIRMSSEILNFFKYISISMGSRHGLPSFFRNLIRDHLNNKKVEIPQIYVNKFVKMFTLEKINHIINDTYYNFYMKDVKYSLNMEPVVKMTIENICINKNITYTAFLEEVYFNFLKQLSLIAINMPKKQRELLRKKEAFQLLENKKHYDVKIEDGKYYEQYKMDLG